MYFSIYSYETKVLLEKESTSKAIILKGINQFDFNGKFELRIIKDFCDLFVIFDAKDFSIFLTVHKEEESVRKGIRIENLETAKMMVKDFVEEPNYGKTAQTIDQLTLEKKMAETERHEKWKVTYQMQRKKDRSRLWKQVAVTTMVLVVLLFVVVYAINGELKFIGLKTDLVVGEITKTDMSYAGGRYYYQTIGYKYIYNGKSYIGEKSIGRRIGIREVGEEINIKIATNEPNIHKIVNYDD